LATIPGEARDTLLALAEFAAPPTPSGTVPAPRFRGLVEYAFDGERWQVRDTLDAGAVGRELDYARDARCGENIVAAGASGDGALAWQRRGGAWSARALPREDVQRTHASAVALGDFDDDGCTDVAVAGAQYAAGGWQSTLWVHLDRGERCESRLLERTPGRETAGALAAAASPCCGTVLVAGTPDGALRAYDARTPQIRRIAQIDVPVDLRGCSVRKIAAAGPHLIVAWAGEPTLDRPDCLEGGGLGAYAWR